MGTVVFPTILFHWYKWLDKVGAGREEELGYISLSGVPAQNRLTREILKTKINSVYALRASLAERGRVEI